MKVVITSIGTTGDIQPLLALCKALAARGHDATICSYKMHATKVVDAGVKFQATAPDFSKEELLQVIEDVSQSGSALKEIKRGVEYFLTDGRRRFEECQSAMSGADLVICHHVDFAGQAAAIKSGIPWVLLGFCPLVMPTSERAPTYERIFSIWPPVNAAMWRLAAVVQERWLFRPVTEFYASVGVPRRGLFSWLPSPYLNIMAASPAIADLPKDLPANTIFAGSWHLREPSVENAALDVFLAKGQAPVVVSFGSMAKGDGSATASMLLRAIRSAGLRAVIQAGWANLQPKDVGEDVFAVGYMPHDQLFRRAMCVIHHGGAGTTAAACKAGVPSIVVPHGGDQYYWGQCLQRRGIAPAPLRRRHMNEDSLRQRLLQVKDNAVMAANAKTVGAMMAAERGLDLSVDALEKLFESTRKRETLAG